MDNNNEILKEIWNARKKIEDEYNNDIDLIFKKFKSKQDQNPQDYYCGKPTKIQKTKTV
jgi:hypothetical protein